MIVFSFVPEAIRQFLGPAVEEIKTVTKPLVSRLPETVQTFLDGDGWFVVLGVIALIFLLWVYSVFRRVMRAIFAGNKKPEWNEELAENLDSFPLPSEPTTDRVLTVKNLRCRLRLVVLASAGKDQDLTPGMAEKILDQAVPGLGEVGMADDPKVRIWPKQFSYEGFATGFLHHVRSPDAPGESSTWVLMAGIVPIGKKKVHMGLVLQTSKPNTIGRVKLKTQQFADVLSVKRLKQ